VAVTGTGAPERLTTAAPGLRHVPGSWTPDGRQIVFAETTTAFQGPSDIKVLTLGGAEAVITTLLDSPAPEINPALSPDGRWLAYVLVDPRTDVFVRPYPNVNDARIPVSVEGGGAPVWSSDGRTLYFRTGLRRVDQVPVESLAPLRFGRPTMFLERKATVSDPFVHALPPINGRVLIATTPTPVTEAPVEYRVVINWTEELAARVKRR
jgi:dipeptidyl aminopeptidase/acylaminoacyl peptidase